MWKLFEDWGTALRNNVFLRTRLRLTFFYILILAAILALFSQAIYVGFGEQIRDTAHHHATNEEQEYFFIDEAEHQLETTMLLMNGLILLIAGGLSYFLAGKTLSPIQETLEQQKQFLSDASHELRTPLAILKTNIEVELSGKKKSPSDYQKNLKSNLEEVNNMSQLVNDLLLLSRLDAHQAKQTVEKISLTEITAQTVERMKKYAANTSISIILQATKTNKIFVKANRDLLMSALASILKNAIDYNKSNGTVTVSLSKKEGYAVIIVEDSGIGISTEKISRVFDRFFRAEPSRGGEVVGTGLGLSIAQAIIQEYQGTITLKSKLGKGTVVIIYLPTIRAS